MLDTFSSALGLAYRLPAPVQVREWDFYTPGVLPGDKINFSNSLLRGLDLWTCGHLFPVVRSRIDTGRWRGRHKSCPITFNQRKAMGSAMGRRTATISRCERHLERYADSRRRAKRGCQRMAQRRADERSPLPQASLLGRLPALARPPSLATVEAD